MLPRNAHGMDAVCLLAEGGEIDDLLVNRRFQGRGYGRKILLWALERRKHARAVLHVAQWNQRALRLYESMGFEVTETIVIGQ